MNGLNDASGFSRKVTNFGKEKKILMYSYHTNNITSLRIDSCGLPAISYWIVYKKTLTNLYFAGLTQLLGAGLRVRGKKVWAPLYVVCC